MSHKNRKTTGIVGKAGTPRPTPEQIAAALAEHNLEVDQPVRFRLWDDSDYDYGKVKNVEKDGSIHLFSEGRSRSIMPHRIQTQTVGPRGGRTWEPLTPSQSVR